MVSSHDFVPIGSVPNVRMQLRSRPGLAPGDDSLRTMDDVVVVSFRDLQQRFCFPAGIGRRTRVRACSSRRLRFGKFLGIRCRGDIPSTKMYSSFDQVRRLRSGIPRLLDIVWLSSLSVKSQRTMRFDAEAISQISPRFLGNK